MRKDWLFPAWLLIILGAVSLPYALYVLLTGAGPAAMVVALMVFGALCLGLGLLLRHRLRQRT